MLVKRAIDKRAPYSEGNEFDKAKAVRRARKGLQRLQEICEAANIPQVDLVSGNEELRNREIELFKMHLSKMSPDDIMNNVAKIKTFSER